MGSFGDVTFLEVNLIKFAAVEFQAQLGTQCLVRPTERIRSLTIFVLCMIRILPTFGILHRALLLPLPRRRHLSLKSIILRFHEFRTHPFRDVQRFRLRNLLQTLTIALSCVIVVLSSISKSFRKGLFLSTHFVV